MYQWDLITIQKLIYIAYITIKKRKPTLVFFFYTQSIYVSDKHLITHKQLQSIVKIELVATYGFKLVVSGLSARTLNVQQFPSIFSTLNTDEQVTVSEQAAVTSLVVGILHGVPLPQHVYSITGLVLHIKQFAPPPSIGLSQESKQLSGQAFSCKTKITFKISTIELLLSFSLLHINHFTLSCSFTINLCLIL